ncbi:hypothetical protein BD310DRAFT_785013, partial [Dichomitus squalens]
MVTQYTQTGEWGNYPKNVRMAGDGDTVRILGAFLGYSADQMAVWSPRLAKIAEVVNRWKLSHAKLDGRRHVAQMIVGGMSQFLTDVQLMPREVMRRLTRIVRDFIWSDKVSTPVAMKHLYQKVDEGGL